MVRTRNNNRTGKNTINNDNAVPISNIKLENEETTSNHIAITPSPSSPVHAGNFTFQGKNYATYEEMVKAKRQRNEEYLKDSGLLDASTKVKEEILVAQGKKRLEVIQRGLKADRKRKSDLNAMTTIRRKSNRLAGVQADGMYVEEEKGRGRIVIAGGISSNIDDIVTSDSNQVEIVQNEKQWFQNRVNDGSDISIKEAVEFSGSKWITENSVTLAKNFVSDLKCSIGDAPDNHTSPRSTTDFSPSLTVSESALVSQIEDLNVDNENCVAKVVPDRIYSIAFHPSPHKLITVAGDKKGNLGFWDVDHKNLSEEDNSRHGVHLFKPFNHAISNLEWFHSGHKLFSSAYDGSMRVFDVQKELFTEVFATYDSSPEYKDRLGYNLSDGWTQYSCIDHRNEDCIFFSTSVGDVVHLDLRQKGKITFNATLSEKKINSISLHANGYAMATAGLDCTVNIWDIRKMNSFKVSPIASQHNTKSISSAFFSPSGKYLLTTTMADTLDIITDAHSSSGIISKPTHRIRHNNRTGRWLSTFMAQWHPTASNCDLFVVGSMQQPRTMEIFDGAKGKLLRGVQGEALTAVVSRCCFHPSRESLICAGGNSSGRVTVARGNH